MASPHVDALIDGWGDCSSSATFDEVHADFTPILARIGSHVGWDGIARKHRFTTMTGVFANNYFYLFTGSTSGYTFGFRIPYDATTDNGLARRTDAGHEGAIDVEMWYTDDDHPQGAYHRIDSNRPLAFSNDTIIGDNPPVPIENAFVRVTTSVPSGSSSQTVGITTGSGSCQWQSASDVSWITITGGASGTGSGSTSFTIAANTGGQRTGHITIAGRTYTITQASL